MTVDLNKVPPLLPADVRRVLEDGKPTPELLDQELAENAFYKGSVADLQTQSTEIRSATNDNTAAITTETTARTTADEALADQITMLTATVGDNTASVENEALARADADSAIAAEVSTLTSTVGANTASIGTLSASVDGVLVQYSVVGTIDTDTGSITLTGARRLDGIGGDFAIRFTASGFVLDDPHLPSGAQNVFTYSTDLGAFQFNVPVLIGTSNLQANSVNSLLSANLAFSPQDYAADGGAWHDLVTMSVPGVAGAYTFIVATLSFFQIAGTGSSTFNMRVYDDYTGTEVLPAEVSTTASVFSFQEVCEHPTTYRFQIKNQSVSGGGRTMRIVTPTRLQVELRRR